MPVSSLPGFTQRYHVATAGQAFIGRDAEVAGIRAFLAANPGAPSAVVIAGAAGIGKTVVWQYVVGTCSPGARVLSCRPAPAESPLAFAALDDLFGTLIEEVLPELPEARRGALDAVLLRGRPEPPGAGQDARGREPERRVLARGILDALRILSAEAPLVLAVDGTQWLDRPSAGVLEYCVRRLSRGAVSIVVTLRDEGQAFPLGLDHALPSARLARVQLGPLNPGVIGEILASRLGTPFSKHTLSRLYEACGGNPGYALETARALMERGRTCLMDEPISIPDAIGDLVRGPLSGLTREALQVGRLVAACRDPREHVIRAAHSDQESWVALEQVIDAGLIERDGDALRFTHPLTRPVLYAEMTHGERRDVHRRLAAHAGETPERAWHLALSAEGPDDGIAAMLDGAADRAASGGAPGTAAVFAEQAVRLTPARHSAQRQERTLRAADHHLRAGDLARGRELIESALASCPAGVSRAPLLLRQATIHHHLSGWTLAEQTFRRALAEAPGDPAIRAHAEQELAFTRLVAGDLPAAARWAKVSLRSAERARRHRLVAQSLARIAVVDFLLGNPVRADLLARAEALAEGAGEDTLERLRLFTPSLARATVLKWCDQLNEARQRFADCYRKARDRGDEAALPFLLYHFSELECWSGNWDAAEEYAVAGCRATREGHLVSMRPAALYSLALVRAHRGQVDDARELAAEVLTMCERSGDVPLSASAHAVLGFAALSLGDHQATHDHLRRLAELAADSGLGEPGVVKFLPDEIEALAALGEVSLAQSYACALGQRGRLLRRPWALATAARCRAYLASVRGDHQGAQAACTEALSEHRRLPMPFELGRTLLVQGVTEQRAGREAEAGLSLGKALATFERLGSPLWAGKARQELSKIAARGPGAELTATQRRVAALIAKGRTNREIAAAMFVTENTVQTHIRHIFQRLGVRSRTELAARLLAPSPNRPHPPADSQAKSDRKVTERQLAARATLMQLH